MPLPRKLEKVIARIEARSDLEDQLLSTLIRKLQSSLSTLEKVFGTSCSSCFERLVKAASSEGASATCLDEYEECVEQCGGTSLRRLLSEREELLVEQVVDQVVGVTEALLILGGVVLAEEEDDDEDGTGSSQTRR